MKRKWEYLSEKCRRIVDAKIACIYPAACRTFVSEKTGKHVAFPCRAKAMSVIVRSLYYFVFVQALVCACVRAAECLD